MQENMKEAYFKYASFFAYIYYIIFDLCQKNSYIHTILFVQI